MSSDLFDLGAVGSGRVVICAAPAPAELPNWVSQLEKIGATLVVCLLEEAESERIGLEAEENALTASGLTFLQPQDQSVHFLLLPEDKQQALHQSSQVERPNLAVLQALVQRR